MTNKDKATIEVLETKLMDLTCDCGLCAVVRDCYRNAIKAIYKLDEIEKLCQDQVDEGIVNHYRTNFTAIEVLGIIKKDLEEDWVEV